ncbi:MAG: UDP-3-O-(3-hydroxymyristoyl)glucosamine N-acyltransferase [Fusobacteriota bacterium]
MYNLREIASLVNGKIIGAPKDNTDIYVDKISSFDKSDAKDITFASDRKYLNNLDKTAAKVIILKGKPKQIGNKIFISIDTNPRNILPKLLKYFKPEEHNISKPIEKTSEIDKTAQISPGSYIGHNVKIGENTKIYPNVTILEGVTIGKNVIIYPNTTIREFCEIGNNVIIQPGAIIGSDGFGYVSTGEGKHIKIEQIGKVIIEDNVEIGANTAIDRGALGDTIIKNGTKIDNLVHIGHNDEIGEDCLIIAQVGISGSVKVGNNTILAGQVGVTGHLEIGDNVVIAARSVVSKKVESNSKMSGYPLQDHRKDLKTKISMTKIPDLIKRVKKLEKRVEENDE